MGAAEDNSRFVEVLPEGELDLELMRDLGALNQELRAADLNSSAQAADAPGVKAVDLASAISIASLALTGVSTLVSVLAFWASQRPKYTVTIDSGKTSSVISGLDKQGMLKVAKQLKDEGRNDRITVRVEGA